MEEERRSREDPLPPEGERMPVPALATPSPTSSAPSLSIAEGSSSSAASSSSSSAAAAAPASSPTAQTKKGWFSGWVKWASTATSKTPVEPSVRAPALDGSSSSSVASSSSGPSIHSYEEGLYALAGGGMTRISRSMLFAGCVYGPRFLRFMGLPTLARTNEAFLIEQTGIKAEDILRADFSSSLKHPGFVLCVDHKLKSVMLVIRGSSALSDAITDLTCGFSRHVQGEFGTKGHAEVSV